MAADITTVGYFMPILSFLLVFVVLYALLKKTKALGDNEWMMIFVSLILSSFFIVEVSLVELVQFSSAWFSVLVMAVFFILLILAFLPGDNPLKFLTKNDWFSWVILGVMVILFLVSSVYIFNFAINWSYITDTWANSEWFGFILLIAVAGVVAATIKGK